MRRTGEGKRRYHYILMSGNYRVQNLLTNSRFCGIQYLTRQRQIYEALVTDGVQLTFTGRNTLHHKYLHERLK